MSPSATLEYPAETPVAPPNAYGINNRKLPRKLVDCIIKATKEAQAQDKYMRLQEILQDAECRIYDAGIQHLVQNRDSCWMQASPGGTYDTQDGGLDSYPDYIGDYNIFTAYGLIMQAKISEPDTGIDFQPIKPDSSEDRESATAAEGIRQQYDIDNNSKDVVKQTVYYLQMGGRAVKWTRTEDEVAQFGVNPNGSPRRKITTTVHGCLECKVPIFANNRSDCWYTIIYDDPDIRVAKADYPWIAKKLSTGQVCLRENSYERIARLGVVQSSNERQYVSIGDTVAHLITRGNVWHRLSAFEAMNEVFIDDEGNDEVIETEDEDGNPVTRGKTDKEKMAEVFPSGVHACIVGNEYAESWDQCMDDCLRIDHAYIAKGQSRKPVMKEMVLVQDSFNQTVNYIRESNDFGVPATYINGDACDFNAITKQKASPGMFREMKNMPAGMTMEQCVYREDERGIPASFMEFMEFLQSSLPQFQLALPPSLWGQAMADQKTSSGYQLAASQAMGILGQLRTLIIWGMSEVYYQACIAVKKDQKYSDELTVPVRGQKGRTAVVRKDSLTRGNFRCFPDQDSGFPESTNTKRQTLERTVGLLAQTPLGSQVFASPSNAAEMIRLQGLNLVIPENESWKKQSREIESLLRQPPIISDPEIVEMMDSGAGVQTILDAIKQAVAAAQANAAQQAMVEDAAQQLAAQATGKPAAPPTQPQQIDPSTIARSSVRVWDSDFHTYEANMCRDWLSGDECAAEQTIGRASAIPEDKGALRPNISGILNVALHRLEHLQKAALEPPPITGPLPAVGSAPKLPPAQPGVA